MPGTDSVSIDSTCHSVLCRRMVSLKAEPAEPAVLGGPGVATMENIVPACPPGLCITKADFLKPEFSIDSFFLEVGLREGGAELDTLRDDLGIYLKVLRSSMIELINQDYADFVNLSTTLVGQDEEIEKIRVPVAEFECEVETARTGVEECLGRVRALLARRADLRQDRTRLAGLASLAAGTASLEQLLAGPELDQDTAERAGAALGRLEHQATTLAGCKLADNLQPRLAAAAGRLQDWLLSTAVAAAQAGDRVKLLRCCRVLAGLGRVNGLEEAVRVILVRPGVESSLQEFGQASEESSTALPQLAAALLSIIPAKISLLLSLTTGPTAQPALTGFDFLVRSYWAEVGAGLVRELPHMASPGNPEQFFSNYNTMVVGLLGDVEKQLGSQESLQRLRNSDSYIAFLQLWNLPVYYQVRLQEIGRPFEAALVGLGRAAGSRYHLAATSQAEAALAACFSDKIFLRPLAHKFVKLALQVLSRYENWAASHLEAFQTVEEPAASELSRSSSSKSLQSLETKKTMSKSISEVGLAGETVAGPTVELRDMIALYCDLELLQGVAPHLPIPPGLPLDIRPALEVGAAGLAGLQPRLASAIAARVAAAPCRQVRAVAEVPRMFRRTNREPPSRPCSYVTAALDSLAASREETAGAGEEAVQAWMEAALALVVDQYLTQVSQTQILKLFPNICSLVLRDDILHLYGLE